MQLLILIVVAMIIALTIWELSKHKILGSGETELAYGVRSVIEERKKGFEPTFLKGIIFGTICFLAFVIPIIFPYFRKRNLKIYSQCRLSFLMMDLP